MPHHDESPDTGGCGCLPAIIAAMVIWTALVVAAGCVLRAHGW